MLILRQCLSSYCLLANLWWSEIGSPGGVHLLHYANCKCLEVCCVNKHAVIIAMRLSKIKKLTCYKPCKNCSVSIPSTISARSLYLSKPLSTLCSNDTCAKLWMNISCKYELSTEWSISNVCVPRLQLS